MAAGWMTRDEAAALAQVSKQTIDRWRRHGGLASTTKGRVVRIKREDFDAFMEGQAQPQGEQAA